MFICYQRVGIWIVPCFQFATSPSPFLTAGTDCAGSSTPYLNEETLDEISEMSCTSVTGDVIIGYADCSSPCTVTSLSSLDAVVSVSGI